AGDLMTEDESRGCRSSTPHHVLVAPTDICGHNSQDDPVLAPPAAGTNEFRKIDAFNLDSSWLDVGHATIASHDFPPASGSIESCGAGFCDSMILLACAAADANCAHHLSVLFDRHAARKYHDSSVVGRVDPE